MAGHALDNPVLYHITFKVVHGTVDCYHFPIISSLVISLRLADGTLCNG